VERLGKPARSVGKKGRDPMRVVWSAVMLAVLAAPAFAAGGDDDEKSPKASIDPLDRIERLEKELKQLREETEARKAGLPTSLSVEEEQDKKDAPKPELDFKASFTDGFHIKSTDGNFDLHVGGRWEEEYRYTLNRRVDTPVRTSLNTFYAREAFLSMDGTLFKNWGFKLNGDFSQNQTGAALPVSTGAIIEEFWFEWKEFKEFRLLFGSFKQPVSFETTDSPRFSELIQRSPMARFIPNFDTGIKAYGSFVDTMFTYELAVTNGRSHLANQGRDNNDDNDGKEYAGRITVAPFVTDKDSFLKGFRVGIYGTLAKEGQGNPITGLQPTLPANIATNELAVTYLTAAGFGANTHFHGDRYRVGGEGTYAVGPFMVRGEFMERHDELFVGTAATGVQKNNLLATIGYYAEATFVVTGEDRIPNARIVPRHPFSIADGGFGALEVAFRWGTVAMNRKTLIDDGGNVANGVNSNRARDISGGINWWPVQNVKICIDYVGEDYGLAIPLSATHVSSHANGILAHFQVDF
jgi:phosphate-selective porin OprO/OprP